MGTVGEVLKTARLKKKLTIEDIVTRTNIRSFYIRAMENDQFEDLPQGDAYRRAFIKNYAQNVDLDLDEMLGLYEHSLEQRDLAGKGNEDDKSSGRKPGLNPAGIIVVILIALVVVVIASRRYQAPRNKKNSQEQVGREKVEPEKNTASIGRKEEEVSGKKVGEAAGMSLETAEVSGAAVSEPPALKLEGKALKDVSFTLRIDHLAPRTISLRAGELGEWGASEKFTLSLPDAGGIAWSLDRSEPQVLGNSGQFLENIVITKKQER